ncbi:MAG: hypothetical protein LBQ33_00275 [Oscillospiraceae bacterium]|jgi:hypothetical protein|nr:hypothetical protein [Oscillospiraceae bacterium]
MSSRNNKTGKPENSLHAAPGEEENQVQAVLRLHWKKIFFISAAGILLVWCVAVLGDFFISRGRAQTALALYTEQRVTLDTEMTIVREERLLYREADGTVVSLAEAGERVAGGQIYATVCENEAQAEAFTQKQTLEQRLAWLKEADRAVNYHAVNVRQLDEQVGETFSRLVEEIDRTGYAGIGAAQEEFLNRSFTLEAAFGGQIDLSGEIAAVEGQLAQLELQALPDRAVPLKAPVAGAFFPQTDGLESVLAPAKLKALTPEAWERLNDAKPVSREGVQGKLVTGFVWYAVALLPAEQAQQLQEGESYSVLFPLESAREFRMKVESVRRGEGGGAAVVLSGGAVENTVAQLRTAKASIVLATHKGLAIPAAALRFQETGEGVAKRTVSCVYIAKGSQRILREVELLYQDGVTAVVAWGNQNELVSVPGDRFTVAGRISSLTQPAQGKLRLVGKDLRLTAENTRFQPAIGEEKITVVTRRTMLYDEVVLSAEEMLWERSGNELRIVGEDFTYQEQRGAGLKIYDAVQVEGEAAVHGTSEYAAG